MPVLHLPRAGRALGDHLDHLFEVEPRLVAEMQSLGQPLHQPGDGDLVDHLGELAGARRPHQPDHLRIGLDHRLGLVESLLLAADHDRQRAVLRARLAAGDRRVERCEAACLGLFGKLARDFGGSRRVVDIDRALAHRLEAAVGADRHGAQVVVVADAGEDEVLAFGGFAGGLRECAAMLGRPLLGLGRGAVVDGDVVAALLLQVSGHGITHHAKPDERNRCHFCESFQSGDPAFLSQSLSRLESSDAGEW